MKELVNSNLYYIAVNQLLNKYLQFYNYLHLLIFDHTRIVNGQVIEIQLKKIMYPNYLRVNKFEYDHFMLFFN